MAAKFHNKEEFLDLKKNTPLFTYSFISTEQNFLQYTCEIHFHMKCVVKKIHWHIDLNQKKKK